MSTPLGRAAALITITLFVLSATRSRGFRAMRSDPLRRSTRLAIALTLFASGVVVIGSASPAQAAVIRPFATRFTMNTTGAIVMTGNTLLTCPATASGCLGARTGSGSSLSANNNNSYTMGYVDVDSDPSTFDSSRNTLSLPATSTVAWAGLYWGADTTAGTNGSAASNPNARGSVLFRTPASGAYVPITGQVDNSPVTGGVRYQGFADVTDLVTAGRSGEYTMANVQAGRGQDRYGGWALVVAYQDPSEPVRNLTIFDGYAVVQQNPAIDQNVAIPVSGFLTPPTGAVRSRVGVVAYEGDLGLLGDSLRLNSAPLTNSLNPETNFFNSSLTNLNSTNTTGDPFQTNMLGFDIDTINVTNGLANSATSATINLNTNSDTYFPGVVTFSTELYAPRLAVAKSAADLNGGTLDVGDTVRYTMQVTNDGADSSSSVILDDVVPESTTYVGGSLKVDGQTVTDAAGDDTGEVVGSPRRIVARLGNGAGATAGGRLPIGATRTVTFDVTVGDTPLDGVISNTATIGYRGTTSGLPLDGVSNTVALAPRPRSDLSVLKSGPSVPVTLPGSFAYQIVVINRGPAVEPAARIIDTLPSEFLADGVVASAGSCVVVAGTVTCDLGPIVVGETVTIRITGSVTTGAGSITNTARVSGSNLDLLPSNNVANAVVALNRPPTGVDRAVSTPSGAAVNIDVLLGASDPDGDPVATAAAGPAANGSVVVNAAGTATYTPNAGFRGTDTFSVTLTDGRGGLATVSITVNVANAGPIAVDDVVATLPDASVVVPVLANDGDANGDAISIVGSTPPTNGGSIVVEGDGAGTITYTPAPGFKGVDTFTYTITDGTDTATAIVTVTVPDAAPIALDDRAITTHAMSVSIDVLANDFDRNGDPAVVTRIVQQPTSGTALLETNGTVTYEPFVGFKGDDTFMYEITDGALTAIATVVVTVLNAPPIANDDDTIASPSTPVAIDVLGNDDDPNDDDLAVIGISEPSGGDAVVAADGTIRYTPHLGFKGVDTFTYTITDNTDRATATVRVTVSNSPPVGGADVRSTGTDTAVTIPVLINDFDQNGDALSVDPTLASTPSHGSAVVNGDGTITYTPGTGFVGLDTFTYTLTDGTDSATASVTIRVLNGPPIAGDDSITTSHDTSVSVAVLTNDSDPNGDLLSIVATTGPANGVIAVNANGTVAYTPKPGFVGPDSFSYTVTDGTDTATAIVRIEVVNSVPVARADAAATLPGTPIEINVLDNDSDDDGDPLTVVSAGPAGNGLVTIGTAGIVRYTPNGGFVGVDSYEYTISDGFAESTATVTISVPDAAPVAVNDEISTPFGQSVLIDVLGNDLDDDGDLLTIVRVGAPDSGGSVVIASDGATVTYTPAAGFVGVETFDYTLSDGALEASATVRVTVLNAPPIANPDNVTTASETPVAVDALDNDSDPNGDAISIAGVSNPANGAAVIGAGGVIVYTPAPGFAGTDTFGYTISDGIDSAIGFITVNVGNAAPTAMPDTATTSAGTPVVIDVLANDVDDNGDTLTIDSITQPDNGTAVINTGGTVTYTPAAGFTGTDTFTYTTSDGTRTVTAMVDVIVTPITVTAATTTTVTPTTTTIVTATTVTPNPETAITVTPNPETPITVTPTAPANPTIALIVTTDPTDRGLPRTGSDMAQIELLAAMFVLGGLGLVMTTRRRRPAS